MKFILMLLGATAFSSVGCASSMVVRAGAENGAHLETYSSYAYGPPEGAPAGFARVDVAPGVRALAQKFVDAELTGRGYTQRENGDLVVRMSTGRRVEIRETPGPSREADRTGEIEETEGALVIDMFDAHTNALVWHSVARDVVEAGKINEDQIHEAVRRMLSTFPAVNRPSAPVANSRGREPVVE